MTDSAIETVKLYADIAVVLATGAMAWFTLRLARETKKLEVGWRDTSADQMKNWREISSKQVETWLRTSREEIGVQTWMYMEKCFDSQRMLRSRRLLAEQIENYDNSRHDEITDEVMGLFESIGVLYNRDLIDKELAYCSFSYYAVFWWEALRLWIEKERRECRDKTLFAEFEKFAQEMSKRDKVDKIDAADFEKFLNDEKGLRVVFPN